MNGYLWDSPAVLKAAGFAIVAALVLALVGISSRADAHSPGVSLLGYGTGTVDGVLSPGEWANGGHVDFAVNVPEGGTTPGTVFAMNDNSNLYLAVRFARSSADPGNTAAVDFDNDHGGGASPVQGDDVILFNPTPSVGFRDEFTTTQTPCPEGSICSQFDTDFGGTNDGAGAFVNNGTSSVYEFAHPLDSADDAHDFSLTQGQTVGFRLSIRIIDSGQIADTYFPSASNPSLWGDIAIACSPEGGDTDCDGIPDGQDNCPNAKNATQTDINNDGVGDACDCFDVLQGPNETGVDCGGSCSACVAPPAKWKNIVPIRLKGDPNAGFIDVVFVPHDSYSGKLSQFENATINHVRNWYLKLDDLTVDSLPSGYRDKFNFYRYTGGFSKYGWAVCSVKLPSSFWQDAPGTDAAGILGGPGEDIGGCASGFGPVGNLMYFTAMGDRAGQVIHESGHAIFGLSDEYGGGGHKQTSGATNNWVSVDACKIDAASKPWTKGQCTAFYGNWAKWDPDDLMIGSPYLCTAENVCTPKSDAFGEACTWRINWAFNNWPAGHSKGVLVDLNINDGIITELSSQLVDGHPDVGLQSEDFRVELLSSSGDLVQTYGISDPRTEIWDGGDVVYRDNVNFSMIFPFHENTETATISDPATGELLASVDLSEATAVGGIVELQADARSPASASGHSSANPALLVPAVAAAAVLTLAAGTRYARRRWLR